MEGPIFALRIFSDRVGLTITIVDGAELLGFPEPVVGLLESLVLLSVDLHLGLLICLEIRFVEGRFNSGPCEHFIGVNLSGKRICLSLNVLLYIVEHVGCKLQQLLSFIIPAVYPDRGRTVCETCHLEGTQSGGWVPTTTKTLLVEFNYASSLLGYCRILSVVFHHSH